MRVLASFVGGHGHFEPLLAVARAVAAAGHEVAFGCPPALRAPIEAAGFRSFAVGQSASGSPQRLELREVDREREDRDLRERFVRRAARTRVPLLLALFRDWQPDVVVCDETDFGAMLAAEVLEVPFASLQVIASGAFVRAQVVGDALDELRAEYDLAPDPALSMLQRYLVLSPFPPSFRARNHPAPRTSHAFRLAAAGVRSEPTPPWSRVRPGAPTAYFTLGTVFNLESGDLFARVLGALRELPINVVATAGPDIDPRELGPQPEHVRVERFVPQAELLPYCDLVVSHAGSGSVLGALTHGLPSLLIPLGADQPQNAERCASLGVAEVLDALDVTPERVRGAVGRLLGERALRRNALRLRDEIAALPDVGYAATLIERLGTQRSPLTSD